MTRHISLRLSLSIFSLATLALSPLRAETELITNDRFADGGGSWILNSPRGAAASTALEQEGEEPILVVSVQNEDEKPTDVRMHRSFGDISAGKSYTVKFKIKATTPNEIVGFIYPENEGSRILWRTVLKTDNEWREYSYTFKGKDTATNCVLGFAQLGKTSNNYSFKDISLTESE